MAYMVTRPRWGLPQWPRWLHGQDGDYWSDPDGYMAKMRTTRDTKMGSTRVAQMATWIWELPEWSRWLMAKMGTTRVAQMATWPRWELPEWPRWLHGQDEDYQSGPDGYIAKMGTNRVAQMATWPRWGLTEWPRWLHCQDGD